MFYETSTSEAGEAIDNRIGLKLLWIDEEIARVLQRYFTQYLRIIIYIVSCFEIQGYKGQKPNQKPNQTKTKYKTEQKNTKNVTTRSYDEISHEITESYIGQWKGAQLAKLLARWSK